MMTRRTNWHFIVANIAKLSDMLRKARPSMMAAARSHERAKEIFPLPVVALTLCA
jgi:hypothetical protein